MSATRELQATPAGESVIERDAEISSNPLSEAQISSPHELTDWVDNVLNTLESRFNSMTSQVDTRLQEMSERIDALESSIEELLMGTTSPLIAGVKARQGNYTKSEAPRLNITDA